MSTQPWASHAHFCLQTNNSRGFIKATSGRATLSWLMECQASYPDALPLVMRDIQHSLLHGSLRSGRVSTRARAMGELLVNYAGALCLGARQDSGAAATLSRWQAVSGDGEPSYQWLCAGALKALGPVQPENLQALLLAAREAAEVGASCKRHERDLILSLLHRLGLDGLAPALWQRLGVDDSRESAISALRRCIDLGLQESAGVVARQCHAIAGGLDSLTRDEWKRLMASVGSRLRDRNLSLLPWVEEQLRGLPVGWRAEVGVMAIEALITAQCERFIGPVWAILTPAEQARTLVILGSRPSKGDRLLSWCRVQASSMGKPVETLQACRTPHQLRTALTLFGMDPLQVLPRLTRDCQRQWCLAIATEVQSDLSMGR